MVAFGGEKTETMFPLLKYFYPKCQMELFLKHFGLMKKLAIHKMQKKEVKSILFFSEAEEKKILDILNELNLAGNDNIVLIDARNDNKPSASNVKL